MNRKKDFQERNLLALRNLKESSCYRKFTLVNQLESIDEESENVTVRVLLSPWQFFNNKEKNIFHRKWLKHGDYHLVDFPETVKDVHRMKDLPSEKILSGLESLFQKQNYEDISTIGYRMRPVLQSDTRFRRIPFLYLLQGYELFNYMKTNDLGLDVDYTYDSSRKVSVDGADIIVHVPSRTKKKSRYTIKMRHVPLERKTAAKSIILSLRSDGDEPKNISLGMIRFTRATVNEKSDIYTFSPHAVAAYVTIAEHYLNKKNKVPFNLNPFLIPKQTFLDFYKRINNNILMSDFSGGSTTLRKPYEVEKSLILAYYMKKHGVKECFHNPLTLSAIPTEPRNASFSNK